MSTGTTAELAEFGRTVREALTSVSGPGRVRAGLFRVAGWDEPAWQVAAGQLGLPGLMLPEEDGGSGQGLPAMAVVLEEAGRALYGSPLFATAALAVPLLLALEDRAALDRFGPALAGGELTATVALAGEGGRWSVDGVRCSARPDGERWLLDGTKSFVVDGAGAGLLLVVARTPDGHAAVFAVEGTPAGLERRPLVTLDHTRPMARLEFAAVPCDLLGTVPGGADAVRAATDVARVLLAAEQVGGAQRCLEMVVDHARQRIQFGRPIGSFQAVKQRLADALVQIECARSAVHAAAATSGAELARDGRVAALLATEAFLFMAAQTIQLHGGLGFTWEHDAHLFFKRARASAVLLGGTTDHVGALAGILETEID